MSGGYFKIIDSVKQGYRFVWQNLTYLAAAASVPLVVEMICQYLTMNRYDESTIMTIGIFELFLWNLPAKVTLGWFMVVEARMILLGERLDRLPTDPAARALRLTQMRAGVMVYLLFSMLVTCFTYVMQLTYSLNQKEDAGYAMAFAMLTIGAMFWALRFVVAHNVAGVGYSLRQFIFRVNGVEFSLRLIGLGFVAALPIMMVMDILISLVTGAPESLTQTQKILLVSISSPFIMAMTAVLNASAVFALRQILGQKDIRT